MPVFSITDPSRPLGSVYEVHTTPAWVPTWEDTQQMICAVTRRVWDQANVYNMLVGMFSSGDGDCPTSWHILQCLLETGVAVAKDPQYGRYPTEKTNDQT